jgi:hypothetical protein
MFEDSGSNPEKTKLLVFILTALLISSLFYQYFNNKKKVIKTLRYNKIVKRQFKSHSFYL